jgi:hypothetical protein
LILSSLETRAKVELYSFANAGQMAIRKAIKDA